MEKQGYPRKYLTPHWLMLRWLMVGAIVVAFLWYVQTFMGWSATFICGAGIVTGFFFGEAWHRDWKEA